MTGQITPGDAARREVVQTVSGLATTILKASTSAMIVLDLEGRIQMFNPAASKLFECSEASVIGENWLQRFAPEERIQRYCELLERHIRDAGDQVELDGLDEMHSATGERCYVRCEATMLRNSTGVVSGVVCSVEDRTRLHDTMWGFDALHKVGLLGRLADNIAHNFNNLLQLIYGSTQLLKLESPDSEHIERILDAAERGTRHIQRMLAFASRQHRSRERIDMGRLTTEMVELLKSCLLNKIQVATALELQATQVVADPGEIENVLLSLAIVARDAMPDGGTLTVGYDHVTVTDADLGHRSAIPAGHFLCLSVRAIGKGIRPCDIEHIFASVSATGDWYAGDGIVETSSEAGKGAGVDFYLPCYCEQLSDANASH